MISYPSSVRRATRRLRLLGTLGVAACGVTEHPHDTRAIDTSNDFGPSAPAVPDTASAVPDTASAVPDTASAVESAGPGEAPLGASDVAEAPGAVPLAPGAEPAGTAPPAKSKAFRASIRW